MKLDYTALYKVIEGPYADLDADLLLVELHTDGSASFADPSKGKRIRVSKDDLKTHVVKITNDKGVKNKMTTDEKTTETAKAPDIKKKRGPKPGSKMKMRKITSTINKEDTPKIEKPESKPCADDGSRVITRQGFNALADRLIEMGRRQERELQELRRDIFS